MVYNQRHQVPCLHCHPESFIKMVQHMIERCMQFQMTRDDCIKALQKHASINPVITLTVWEELRKENQSFFQAYLHPVSPQHDMIRDRMRHRQISHSESSEEDDHQQNS